MDKKKVGIVSCYFQPNYGSMLQAYATQMALDRMGIENETINIDGFNREIKKAKSKYFIKAALTSDILLSKMGMMDAPSAVEQSQLDELHIEIKAVEEPKEATEE